MLDQRPRNVTMVIFVNSLFLDVDCLCRIKVIWWIIEGESWYK